MLLHQRIQKILDHRKWKKGRLAAVADVDPGGLSRIMDGTTSQPAPETLQKIGRALDVTQDYLMDGEDEDLPVIDIVTSQSLNAFLREYRSKLQKEDCLALEVLRFVPEAPQSVAEWKRLVVQLQHLGYFVGKHIR